MRMPFWIALALVACRSAAGGTVCDLPYDDVLRRLAENDERPSIHDMAIHVRLSRTLFESAQPNHHAPAVNELDFAITDLASDTSLPSEVARSIKAELASLRTCAHDQAAPTATISLHVSAPADVYVNELLVARALDIKSVTAPTGRVRISARSEGRRADEELDLAEGAWVRLDLELKRTGEGIPYKFPDHSPPLRDVLTFLVERDGAIEYLGMVRTPNNWDVTLLSTQELAERQFEGYARTFRDRVGVAIEVLDQERKIVSRSFEVLELLNRGCVGPPEEVRASFRVFADASDSGEIAIHLTNPHGHFRLDRAAALAKLRKLETSR